MLYCEIFQKKNLQRSCAVMNSRLERETKRLFRCALSGLNRATEPVGSALSHAQPRGGAKFSCFLFGFGFIFICRDYAAFG